VLLVLVLGLIVMVLVLASIWLPVSRAVARASTVLVRVLLVAMLLLGLIRMVSVLVLLVRVLV